MKEYFEKYSHLDYALILLVLFFITETWFKIVLFLTGETLSLLQATKGVVLFFVVICVLKKEPKSLWFLYVLLISFFIGQFTLAICISKEVAVFFIKLVFPILLFLFFNKYTLSNQQKERLFRVFEYIMFLNALVIIIGFLFNIKIFNSYLFGRFGYNGLFVSSTVGSYVYCLTLIYLLEKYKKGIFKRLPNIIIISSMFFIGTKVAYVFLMCFFAIYLWKYSAVNKKIIGATLIVLVVLGIYVFLFKYGLFTEIRHKDGFISALMSYRDELLINRTLPYIEEYWHVVNYLFGGVSDVSTRSQMEIIDVFYFFGIFGGFLFYYIFFKMFLVFKPTIHIAILLIVLFIIVLLAGNFFSYPAIAIYLVILREQLKINEQNPYSQHINP